MHDVTEQCQKYWSCVFVQMIATSDRLTVNNQWCSGKYLFGGTHGERGARAYNGGLGAEPPAGSRGRAPGGVRGAKPP